MDKAQRDQAIIRALAAQDSLTVANQFGLTQRQVTRIYRASTGNGLSEDRINEKRAAIEKAIHDGASTGEEISALTGLNMSSVYYYLKRYGLTAAMEANKEKDSLIGQQVGLWLVGEQVQANPAKYKCVCQGCMTEHLVRRRYLLNNESKSCTRCAARLRQKTK